MSSFIQFIKLFISGRTPQGIKFRTLLSIILTFSVLIIDQRNVVLRIDQKDSHSGQIFFLILCGNSLLLETKEFPEHPVMIFIPADITVRADALSHGSHPVLIHCKPGKAYCSASVDSLGHI